MGAAAATCRGELLSAAVGVGAWPWVCVGELLGPRTL